ncbi:uncharacterized protein FYW47_008163 [Aplochiton taeniatus]
MTSKGCQQATTSQDMKEVDSVKESISDIINQLQDVDPARLSFSPFLDLDTQISLAPVSDSPESSVKELYSSSDSVAGSQHSPAPLSANGQQDSPDSWHQQPTESLMLEQRAEETEEGVRDGTVSSHVVADHRLEEIVENFDAPNLIHPVCNGRGIQKSSPRSNNLESLVDECRSLIDLPPESIELVCSQEQEVGCSAVDEGSDRDCCCCICFRSRRVTTLCSVMASLLCTAGSLYALYFYLPVEAPDCPDTLSRLTFSLYSCLPATIPILIAMLTGAMCQFCSGSLNPMEPLPRKLALQQLFVTSSTEQLTLYVLNMVVLTLLLPQDQLRIVPMFTAFFTVGRMVYWFSLSGCSSWRCFGSGLSWFPLLAVVAFNLYSLYDLGLRHFLFRSDDTHYNLTTPSSIPVETSQSHSNKPHSPSDTPDTVEMNALSPNPNPVEMNDL